MSDGDLDDCQDGERVPDDHAPGLKFGKTTQKEMQNGIPQNRLTSPR